MGFIWIYPFKTVKPPRRRLWRQQRGGHHGLMALFLVILGTTVSQRMPSLNGCLLLNLLLYKCSFLECSCVLFISSFYILQWLKCFYSQIIMCTTPLHAAVTFMNSIPYMGGNYSSFHLKIGTSCNIKYEEFI